MGPDGAVEFTGVDEVGSVVSQTLCEFVAQSFCRGVCVEVPLLHLPQAHSIDDLGEHLEKRLAVWLVGLDGLYRHNFGNKRQEDASKIMRE